MSRIDSHTDASTGEVTFRTWPDDGAGGIDIDGMIVDFDGTVRPLTDSERAHVARRIKDNADETERDQARAMISDLRAYLDLDAPTAGQTRQVVRRLCRTSIRLIRDQYGDG